MTGLMIVTMRLTKKNHEGEYILKCCDGRATELVDGTEPIYDENGELEPFVKDFYICDRCDYCMRQSEIKKIVRQMKAGETVLVTAKTWADTFYGQM